MFNNGPPGTRVEANWLNTIQEEIANVIEEAGISLKVASTDTRDQLLAAILIYVNSVRLFWSTEIKTTSFSVTEADNGKLFLVDASVGTIICSLPSPTTSLNGFAIGVKKIDESANVVQIDPVGATQIDKVSAVYLRLFNGAAVVVCNGIEYFLAVMNEITGEMCVAALKDPVSVTPGLRTLGTGANQALPGNAISLDAIIKAWIQFDGTGVIAINDSYNVSSITDNAVGDYSIVWDINFADTTYCMVGMAGDLATSDQLAVVQSFSYETTRARINTRLQEKEFTTVNTDFDKISIIVIGDQ